GGTTPYSYQWYSGTSSTCSSDITLLGTSAVQVVQPALSTYYCYAVTDSAFAHATQPSATDLVTVNPILVAGDITPSNPTIDTGQSIVLTANPSGGTAPYSFQWYSGTSTNCSSDTAPLGTASTQTFTSASSAYYCYKVTDGASGNPTTVATSSSDLVTVNPGLVVKPAPGTPPTIDIGQSSTLSATCSGGTSPYTCQWLQEGPSASGYSDLGSSSSCVSPVSISTGVLATNGTWSFELQ